MKRACTMVYGNSQGCSTLTSVSGVTTVMVRFEWYITTCFRSSPGTGSSLNKEISARVNAFFATRR